MKWLLALFASVLASSVAGCEFKPGPDDFTEAEIDEIAARCAAQRDKILVHKGWVNMSYPDDDDLPMKCVLRALKASNKTKIQLIGNQLHIQDSRD